MKTQDNLIFNPDFSGGGSLPDGWSYFTPRPELGPNHSVTDGPEGRRLVLSGNGDIRAFGCWRGKTTLTDGKWYRAEVRVQTQNIAAPHLSVFVNVAGHFLVPTTDWQEETRLERTFLYSADQAQSFELYFRASERGTLAYWDPCVVEIAPPRHRVARVATVRFGEVSDPIDLEAQRKRIAEKLDQAAALRPDIVCLPEFAPVIGLRESDIHDWTSVSETVPDGPVCRILSAAAEKSKMYVLAGLIERRGKHLFNTAVLFDRHGRLLGQYDKTHLTFMELVWGVSCGESYPLFDLDFGRIAVHICYDEWFPEVAHFYAQRGAKILFLPVAGGKPITWRTRALDNRIYFVSASITPPSMIIDASGVILTETHGDGVVCADLNLDWRQTNWYKDPTLTYGVPGNFPMMRNTLNDWILDSK